jgi:uncharacterized protein (TIGR02145 family)
MKPYENISIYEQKFKIRKTMKNNNLIFKLFLLTAVLFSSSGYAQTVTIGTQVWTSTNLNVSTYRNGDIIPQVQNRDDWARLNTGAWCYYDLDPSNETKYGKLYNWYAVNDPRGLAPKGYHIPTDAEWKTLTDHLGGKAGKKMKSLKLWRISYREQGKGTNSSGFSGLPGGHRDSGGDFSGLDGFGFWWSSSESSASFAFYYKLSYDDDIASQGTSNKQDGFSIRCIRD